jgi:hypothetical protein
MTDDLTLRWEHLARSPGQWLVSAEDLKACAEIIGQRFVEYLMKPMSPEDFESSEGVQAISFGPIFQMLAGYSIEALVKGICVAREPNAVRGGKLPKWLTTHRLGPLLRRANVEVAAHDERFLRRLERSVLWAGRYPVDKTVSGVHKQSSTGDLAVFRRIYEQLVVVLQEEIGPADKRRGER